jgi:RNA polymerase sigma factor (sigma-70 family)
MGNGQHAFVQHLQTLFDAGSVGELTDRQLLERFTGHDELAFAVLVKRHGPMVLRACRAILRDRHEAEDAFQATFMVLARKAGSLWVRDSLGPWLFRVASRVAACANSAARRRQAHEQKAAELAALNRGRDDPSRDDRDAMVHEEVDRLPQPYRAAIVLCDLEGLTQEQAARRLGWPAGTVRSRLARGRDRLRDRLTRRGLAPAGVPVGASPVLERAPAVVPAALAETTIQAGLHLAARRAVTGTTALALTFTEGALRIMFWTRFTWIASIAMAGGLLVGSALVGHRAMGWQQAPPDGADSRPNDPVGVQEEPTAPAPADPGALSPADKARLDAAGKLRQGMLSTWEGQDRLAERMDLMEYLTWERRCAEVEAELTVKTDLDRVRFLERRVVELKRIEPLARERFDKATVTMRELFALEFELREAEAASEKARARLTAGGAAVSGAGPRRLNPEPRLADQPLKKAAPGDIAPADDKPIEGDLARLQGTWTARLGQFQSTMTIRGHTSWFDNVAADGSRIGLISTIDVNDRARPHKTIDATRITRYGPGGRGPDSVLGIYEFLDEDTIRINNGFLGKRPDGFDEGRNGSTSGAFILKREAGQDKARD